MNLVNKHMNRTANSLKNSSCTLLLRILALKSPLDNVGDRDAAHDALPAFNDEISSQTC